MHIKEELLWSYLHNETDEVNKNLIADHLRNCDTCQNKFLALENQEKFFQSINYPMPSERFITLTSELVLSRAKTKKKPWVAIFKTSLCIALVLILAMFIWLILNTTVNFTISSKTSTIALYTLPLVLLMFLMKIFEVKVIKYL